MHNIKLTIEYDGTRYQGWQHKGNKNNSYTISGKIKETFSRLIGEEIDLFCGARTEAGVHAAGQIVSFKTERALCLEEIKQSANHYLPRDIVILSAEEVPEQFHAALNAKAKSYLCLIDNSFSGNPFLRRYAFHVPETLSLSNMEEGARLLLGKHDFKNLSFAPKKKSSERELFTIQFSRKEGQLLCIRMEANDFLRQMPQMIVGILLEIGLGKRDPESIRQLFTGEETAKAFCPSHAFCLESIHY